MSGRRTLVRSRMPATQKALCLQRILLAGVALAPLLAMAAEGEFGGQDVRTCKT